MIRSSLFTALGLVAIVSTASAQPKAATALAGGVIVGADASARTIQVKTGDHTQTYTIAEDAKLEAGKKALQAADLAGATGQRVTIWYTTNGDARVAGRVKVVESKGSATAKVVAPAAQTPTPE